MSDPFFGIAIGLLLSDPYFLLVIGFMVVTVGVAAWRGAVIAKLRSELKGTQDKARRHEAHHEKLEERVARLEYRERAGLHQSPRRPREEWEPRPLNPDTWNRPIDNAPTRPTVDEAYDQFVVPEFPATERGLATEGDPVAVPAMMVPKPK